LLWLPQCVAEELEGRERTVLTGSTTRSPARVIDRSGYPLRSVHRWAIEGWDAPRFTYNADRAASDTLVVLVDDGFDDDADAYVRAFTAA
ncbi:TRSP domain-containing protein, partial [Escherichia coli]